jgi:hypothetical protein
MVQVIESARGTPSSLIPSRQNQLSKLNTRDGVFVAMSDVWGRIDLRISASGISITGKVLYMYPGLAL